MIYKLIVLWVFFLSIVVNINAQKIRLDEAYDMRYKPTMKNDEKNKIKAKVDSLINAYAKLATLVDIKKKKVTDESAANFYKLFSTDARIAKDYEEVMPIDLVSPRAYANAIFSFFPNDGVKFKVERAYLDGIVDDRDYYIVFVVLDKAFYNYLNNNKIPTNSTGRFLEEEIKIDVPKSNFSKLKITQIRRFCTGKKCAPPDFNVNYKIYSTGANSGIFPLIPTLDFNDKHENSSLKMRQGVSWSIGADWTSNRFAPNIIVRDSIDEAKNRYYSKHKTIFLTAGFRLGQTYYHATLKNFEHLPFNALTEDSSITDAKLKSYTRSATNIDVTERTTFNTVSLPVGFMVRFSKGKQNTFFLDVRGVPHFVFYATNYINGTGTYNAFLGKEIIKGMPKDNLGYSLLKKNTDNKLDNYTFIIDADQMKGFDVGGKLKVSDSKPPVDVNREISYANREDYYLGNRSKKTSQFGFERFLFSLKLSPSIFHDFSTNDKTWGVMAGLDIEYYFNSFYKQTYTSNPDIEPFKFQYGYKGSIPEYYSQKTGILSIGFRVGVYKKLQEQL